ncbi:MAG: Gfo/Idh/MocA family oxidoreductase [Chloroflexi bacterium]|nr:Gfo/Idh/MocA family oxidoreductase [Chloroflexota bacterium]
MTDKVRWGVLGVARVARNWMLPAFLMSQQAEVVAVASRQLDRARLCATAHGIARAYGSYDALLSDPDVEAVYIPLPNHLHKEWALAALCAGKHVLCEKPIALAAADAVEIAHAARSAERLVAEAFMYRYSPLMRAVRDIVNSGRLGDLRLMHTSFAFQVPDDPTNVHLQAAAGGGCLYDIGCYAVHAQRLVSGREPRQAWATLSRSPKHAVDMSCAGTLDYGGLYGTFEVSYGAFRTNTLRLVGTEGVLQTPDGFTPRNEPALLLVQSGRLTERLVTPAANPYLLQIEDFSETVRGRHALDGAQEALDANTRVLDACLASAGSGAPVKLS